MIKEDSLYIEVKPMVNLGFDLHGVLDTYADRMVPLLQELCDKGYAIHVLSGPSKQEVEEELLELGYKPEFHYHYLFSIVDYLKSEQVEMWKDDKDTWWAKDDVWWRSKGNYCKIMHCDFMFDNSIGYEEYMPPMTDFIHIKEEQDILDMIEMLEIL